jgi:hypothetical protein
MPSILGSAELKFAKRFVPFATPVETEVKITVSERKLRRKLFLAVVPTSSDWTVYRWSGRVEFRLKGNPVETWNLGYAISADTNLPGMSPLVPNVILIPPYWVETFSAASATWPVVEPADDQQTALVYDTNTGNKYHVHMKPVRFTGHFDEVAFIVSQSGTDTPGETNSYLIVGCQSDPLGD